MKLGHTAAALMLAGASAACNGMLMTDAWRMHGAGPSGPRPSLTASQRAIPAFATPPLTPQALTSHVQTLSSDEFGGRAPGTRGEQLTIDYVTHAFSALGLQPGAPNPAGGQPLWTQDVPMVTATVTNNPVLNLGGANYAYGTDFVAWTKRLDENVNLQNAELVFVGYGVVAPELGWDDYAGVDMNGKVAVILINDPDFATGDDRGFGGRAMTYYGRWVYKYEEAARQGAVGAIIIHEDAAAAYTWPVVNSSWTGPQFDLAREDRGASRVAVEGWIQNNVARELFRRAGLDLAAEQLRAQRPDFTPVSLNQRASIDLQSSFDFSISHNLIALLPGSERPEEAVLYSAHWDHLGECTPVDGDNICNGALDNATGVAGLIELARNFAANGPAKRSVAFISFTGEESGLLGSQYYAAHPTFRPADIAAMINMDGLSNIAPARDITVIGFGQTNLQDMLAEAARRQGRVITAERFPERGSFYRSDQFNLAKIGVPVLYTGAGLDFFDGGVERGRAASEDFVAHRYHKPDDEWSPDWDMTGAMRDLQLLYTVGREVADSDQWPNYRQGSEFRAIRDASRTADGLRNR